MVLLVLRRVRAAAWPLLLAGCAAGSAVGPGPQAGPEGERHRAALAVLTVQNATARHLRIAFRPAAGPGNDVVLGSVGPDSSATVAPLPAGEPVVLAAIADDSSRYSIAPRSFELGEQWTWHIPADAVFASPAARTP